MHTSYLIMARITVEDCLKKVENQYDLVLLAKERTHQLNSGADPLVPEENDKRTVVALREIAEGKVLVKDLEEKAVNKMRKYPDDSSEPENNDELADDDFHKLYKGEISKSGTPILPSKRVRKVPLVSEYEENKKKEKLAEKDSQSELDTSSQKSSSATDKTSE